MIVIGLTGGIGAGKSEVASRLRELGAVIVNADQVGHEAYTPHCETWREVVKTFGEEILRESGEIDRSKLGTIVFADPEKLARLNGIMHPRMAVLVKDKLQDLRSRGVAVAVVEAAVLFEAGWDYLVDEVWTIDAPVDDVVGRLQKRNGLDATEARKRIASQMSPKERADRSAVVIANSGDLAALDSSVKELWRHRVEKRIERT